MALRNIVKYGDDTLRKNCKPVTEFNKRLWDLLDDMAETMYAADGVGLAAPQVGVLRRVITIDVGEGLIELINPVIIAKEGEERGIEGCLSCPGKSGYVVRPQTAKVRAQDRNGKEFELEGSDMLARAFCHEIDHLNGVIFLDLADEVFDVESEPEEKRRRPRVR